ncbi:Hypothetical_protein [Hexamita inflata]|uniref:Hypothetical_protein n=1 Tax=Hexamita inflata TaxID=28002 RepID=A0AA86UA93_9EUKA|nr:Hypothetical protein HINF_LOCUS11852 [Hexamita inflata]CAI9947439.1 Hypothetical protein HINF_LOCUS35084 [Hexamita inflata]
MLNCKCNGNYDADYNGADPIIYIENIDDSCKQFITTEKAAGRTVIELTINVLCKQLEPINIPKTEKYQLIQDFIQRRGTSDEEVIGAMYEYGFDITDFVKTKGISNDQVLVILIKYGIKPYDFAVQKQIADDKVLITMIEYGMDVSDFARRKEISIEYILILMMISGFDIQEFADLNDISQTQTIEIISQSKLPIEQKIQTLKQYFTLELQEQQENINSTLIKNEFEQVNERVIQFVNNRCREISLELMLKQLVLNQQQNNGLAAADEIQKLKLKIYELEKLLIEEQYQHQRDLALKVEYYGSELQKSKNFMESMKIQYQKDLKQQFDRYRTEIASLQQSNLDDHKSTQLIINYQQKQYINECNNDQQDLITNQLQEKYFQLQQQLNDEKQDHDDQYTLMLEQLQRKNLRYSEVYKQLTEERAQRLQYFQQLSEKQTEITNQLELRGNEQAQLILKLQTDNQNLLDNLTALKQQIEIINVSQYQLRIEKQDRQLYDKDKQIEILTSNLQQINVKLLQNRQIDEVLDILRTMAVKNSE